MIILKMVIKKTQHTYQMSYNKQKISNLVKDLNRFCFDSKNINKLDLLSKKRNDDYKKEKKIEKKTIEKKIIKNDFFIPDQQDNIFWCWYIFQHGIKDYNILSQKHFTIEKSTKIDWVSFLRENKSSVKQLKFKLSSLENNLVNEKKMHIKTLETVCFLNNIDFYIIKNKMFYENSKDNDDDQDKLILKYYPNTKNYGILINNKDMIQKINEFKKNLFLVNDIEKPLKGISSYKLKDLQDIAEQLNISLILKNSEKKKTKKVLYSEIQEQLV